MKELKEILTNPLSGLDKDDLDGVKERFHERAKTLFENYGLKCGDKIFRFAELEFYYYKNEESGDNNWDATWNRETYPRNKDAGQLFFHYSGVDICFQCHFDEKEKNNEYGEYGGILIRSLLDGDKIIAGPLFCVNTMLNECKGQMPQLVSVTSQTFTFETTTRCGIKSDLKQEKGKELYLCYYATSVNNKNLQWDKASERIAWDKSKKRFTNQTRNYKKERNFK